jgi:hypothetical protein
MARSARFRLLTTRLSFLRRHLLPSEFSPTGSYSERQLDRARGYRLLVHAEFEAYIEDRCWELVDTAIRKWKVDRRERHVLMSLLARCGPNSEATMALGDCIGKAGNAYFHTVRKNNGVREYNLVGLLQPVGIERTELDGTWLSTIDSFGSDRGEVAHSSVGAQKPIDPRTELVIVKQIRDGFEDVDELLNSLA